MNGRRIAAILAASLNGCALFAGEATTLRIRPDAVVSRETILLRDVLVLDGVGDELRAVLENAPLFPDGRDAAARSVSHVQIARRLEQLEVNTARVLLAGAAECRISRVAAEGGEGGARLAAHETAIVRASPDRKASAGTLADAVRGVVEKEFAEAGVSCDLEFERAGREYLNLTTPPWEFGIRASGGKGQLGVREFRVTILRDGRAQRTVQIAARVKAMRQVLVARKPLAVGTYVQRDDVGLEERVFEDAADFGLGKAELAIGQQVKRFVAAGEMLKSDDLKTVDLVQRSRPVTVVDSNGAVSVRLSGIALDSGGLGDTVRVRIGEAKKRRELRGVVTAFGTVRAESEEE